MGRKGKGLPGPRTSPGRAQDEAPLGLGGRRGRRRTERFDWGIVAPDHADADLPLDHGGSENNETFLLTDTKI